MKEKKGGHIHSHVVLLLALLLVFNDELLVAGDPARWLLAAATAAKLPTEWFRIPELGELLFGVE